ncbi:uncharacterized protein LOC135955919 isoform X1 [Calliphora vicina]|uniref:uncharacterized protein LOC135955919 isoform X1 n=1 Tax=Calliphora vicina TaxID=7373 RepID=UPI00325A6027
MHFWPFKKSENENKTKDIKNEDASNKFSQFYNIGQQFNEFIHNNMPIGFEQKFNKTKPYIMASFIAWPVFWLYRGLEWSSHRQNARLPMYIQKTYLQAKFMQFSIIMFGLTLASLMENSASEITNTSNEIKR